MSKVTKMQWWNYMSTATCCVYDANCSCHFKFVFYFKFWNYHVMKISCNKIGLIAAELLARLVSFFVNKILNMNT